MTVSIILCIFFLLSLYYVWAILFLLKGLRSLAKSGMPQNHTFSVIIAAHNEEKSIKECLGTVLNQTIAADRFEVILVNDRSTDATGALASEVSQRHSNLSIITLSQTPQGFSPKKYALSCGVKEAKNGIVVFTDADCFVPATWLETLDRYFDAQTGMVQGITAYRRVPGMNPWLLGLQAVDFLSHGVVSASGIGAGLPINSNANNLAFRLEAFNSVAGFDSVNRIVSGDDDLLMQKIWRSGKWKIRYMTDRASAVETLPTDTIRGIFEQRKRWGSKTVHYTLRQKAFLSGIFSFYLSIIAALVLIPFHSYFLAAFGALALVKLCGDLLLMLPGTKLLGQTGLRKYILPASLIQLPLVILAVLFGVFGRFSWKRQRFKRTLR